MITKISTKVSMLADTSKLLVIGTLAIEVKDILNKYFKDIEYLNLNEDSIDILNENYYESFDLIIYSFSKEDLNIFESSSKTLPKNSISIIDESLLLEYKKYLNSSFATFINPFEESNLLEKIYAILSTFEMDSIIKTKQKVINRFKDKDINDEIDTFLDKYSGEIMFINDDLNDSLERLKDLEISKELFSKLSSNLVSLSNVMKMNSNLEHLSALFLEFSQFLDSIVLDEIEPSRYSAFDYLTNIIEDLTIYIDELFVYRLFKDVRIFEDSMSNNINYLEAQLFGLKEKEEDNLEFF